MPRYDYRCKSCASERELNHAIGHNPTDTCECGGELQRLISKSVGIAFKGSGFYVTDSQKKTSHVSPSTSKKTTDSTATKEVAKQTESTPITPTKETLKKETVITPKTNQTAVSGTKEKA